MLVRPAPNSAALLGMKVENPPQDDMDERPMAELASAQLGETVAQAYEYYALAALEPWCRRKGCKGPVEWAQRSRSAHENTAH